MSQQIELVQFGDALVPFPVSLGVIHEFTTIAKGLRKSIAEAHELAIPPLRKQLADVERVIAQLQGRHDAVQAELDQVDLARVPPGVFRGGTGFYYTTIDGVTCVVCEDCWKPVPHYSDRDLRNGLISPESDGDEGGNFVKRRKQDIEGKIGEWHPGKVVCAPCYRAAFWRVYPGASVQAFDESVIEDAPRVPVSTVLAPYTYIPEPKESGDPSEPMIGTPVAL